MKKIVLSIIVFIFLATNNIYGQININYFANIDKLIDNKSNLKDFNKISNSDFFVIYNNVVFTFKLNKYFLDVFQNGNKIFTIENIIGIDKEFWDENNSVLYLCIENDENDYQIYSFNLKTLKISKIQQHFYKLFDFNNNKFYFEKGNNPLTIFSYDVTNSIINKVFEVSNEKFDEITFFKNIENSDLIFIEAFKYDGDDFEYAKNIVYNNKTKEKLIIDLDDIPYDFIVKKRIIEAVPQLKKITNNREYQNTIAYLLINNKYNYCCKELLYNYEVKGFFISNNIKKAEFISSKVNELKYVSNKYSKYPKNQILPFWLSKELENNLYHIFNNLKIADSSLINLNQIELLILENSIYFKNKFLFENDFLTFYFNSYYPYFSGGKYLTDKSEVESRFTTIDKHNLAIIDKYIVKVDLSQYSQQDINIANEIIDYIDTLSQSIYADKDEMYNKTFNRLKNLVSSDFNTVANNKELIRQAFLQRALDIQGQDLPIAPVRLHYQTRNIINSLYAIYGYKFSNQKWGNIYALFKWYKPTTKTPAIPPDVNSLIESMNRFYKEVTN